MAGCFGNHPVDRHLEGELFRYLEEDSIYYCDYICGFSAPEDCWEYNEEKDVLICPKCGGEIKL